MNRERPQIVLVMAILNCVLGAFYLLCGCSGVVTTLLLPKMFDTLSKLPTQPGQPNPFGDMQGMFEDIPGFYPLGIGSNVLMLVLAVLLIVAGVGMFYMKPWSRWLSIGFSVAMVALQAGTFAYQVAVVQPATLRWQEDYSAKMKAPPPPTALSAAFSTAGGCMNFVMYTIYPIALAIIMFLPQVSAAFAARQPEGGGWNRLSANP